MLLKWSCSTKFDLRNTVKCCSFHLFYLRNIIRSGTVAFILVRSHNLELYPPDSRVAIIMFSSFALLQHHRKNQRIFWVAKDAQGPLNPTVISYWPTGGMNPQAPCSHQVSWQTQGIDRGISPRVLIDAGKKCNSNWSLPWVSKVSEVFVLHVIRLMDTTDCILQLAIFKRATTAGQPSPAGQFMTNEWARNCNQFSDKNKLKRQTATQPLEADLFPQSLDVNTSSSLHFLHC